MSFRAAAATLTRPLEVRSAADRRGSAGDGSSPEERILQLQRLAGNDAVAQLLGAGLPLQRERADEEIDDADVARLPGDEGVPLTTPGADPATSSAVPDEGVPAKSLAGSLPKPADASSDPRPGTAPDFAPPTPGTAPAPREPSSPATTSGHDGQSAPAPKLGESSWSDFFDGFTDPLNDVRAVLEIGRAIPAVGIVSGLGADAINTYQDLSKFDEAGAPSDNGFTETVVRLRDACMIINNVIGALAQTDQVAQDAATGSVIGTPLVAVTAPVQEGLKGVKVWFDAVQLPLDVIVVASAHHNAMQPPRSQEQLKWSNDVLTNYEANVLGDFVTTVLDVVDAGTAGYTNCETIGRGMRAVSNVFKTGTKFAQGVKSVLLGWFGVYGGGLMPRYGQPSASAQRDFDAAGAATDIGGEVAANAILGEITAMRGAYAVGDALMTSASGGVGEMLEVLNESMTRLLGGQDPAKLIRDNAHQMLDRLHGSIGDLTQMSLFAGNAQENAMSIIASSDEALAMLDRLIIPEIHVDHMQDDGVIAGVVNAGADVADSGLQAVVGTVREMFESAKTEARQPILQVRGHAGEIGEFCQFLQEHSKHTIELFNAKIESFNAGLARCETFGDIANLIVAQIAESLGLGADFNLDDIMREWQEIPAMLDEAEAWAQGLRAGRSTADGLSGEPVPEAALAEPPPADESAPNPGGG